jgi:hypothetical protein
MDCALFSKVPGETIQLKYVEPVRRESDAKDAERSRPHGFWLLTRKHALHIMDSTAAPGERGGPA